VVAICQHHVIWRPVLGKPLDPLGREHRVKHDALRLEVVGADIGPDVLVASGPVPQPGPDLTHHRHPTAARYATVLDPSTIISYVETLERNRLEGTALDAWRSYLQSHASILRELDAELASVHGMTTRDYEVLLYLAQAPERRLPMSALATSTMLTRSGITRLVDGLVDSGWIERVACESDARVSYARLTDLGFEKLRDAGCTHVAGINRLFLEHFSPEEINHLASLLSRLPGASGSGSCTVGEPDPGAA
jgi:DNA-binding MarR family transcriptional regulator